MASIVQFSSPSPLMWLVRPLSLSHIEPTERKREVFYGESVTMANMMLIWVVAVICLAIAGERVVAGHTQHVVGDDRGWDPATKLSGWSSGRTFRVGDKIWFAYSVVSESMVELGSKEEYELCDVSNPIRMYTDGLNGVPLEEEGARYFVSGKEESCKNGLKLHVVVQPEQYNKPEEKEIATSESSALTMAAADGPTPSASTNASAGTILVVISLLLFCLV